MNLVLLYERERLDPRRFLVRGARARHVQSVLRANVGDEIRIGLLDGPIGTGVVADTKPNAVELVCTWSDTPPRGRVDLILAVPRPKMLKRLLPQITAFAVDRIWLVRSWRVERSYLTSKLLEAEVQRPLLHEGLMQARLTHEPRIVFEPRLMPFIENTVAALQGARLIFHPDGRRSLADVSVEPDSRVVVAIGPEGGWIADEVAAFERVGFDAVTMGPRPLRVETACVAALAQVDLLARQERRAP